MRDAVDIDAARRDIRRDQDAAPDRKRSSARVRAACDLFP
jgi:hypothetical protein